MMDEAGRSTQNLRRYWLPNKMGRMVILAMEEVMGRNGVNAVLNLGRLEERIGNLPPNDFDKGFSFDELAQLLGAVDEMYGPRGGGRLTRRAGRACFRLGIKDLGPVLGIADLAFRVVPLRMRLRVGLEVVTLVLNKFSDHLVRLREDEQYFHWTVERCGSCWGRECDSPCCHLAVGLLEEALYWISGGSKFYVEEVSCMGTGDPTCTILVGKRPLD